MTGGQQLRGVAYETRVTVISVDQEEVVVEVQHRTRVLHTSEQEEHSNIVLVLRDGGRGSVHMNIHNQWHTNINIQSTLLHENNNFLILQMFCGT